MRRRFFWGTTGVVAFVLILVGMGLVLLLQNLAVQATREEMTRQAQVIELIVKQQFQLARAEGFAVDRLDEIFESDRPILDRMARTRRDFARFLRSLLDAARDIAGGSRVELVLLDPAGNVRSFGEPGAEAFLDNLGIDVEAVQAGHPQFLTSEATNGGGSLVTLVHPFAPVQGRAVGSTILLVLARETPVIDWARIVQPLLLILLAAAGLAALLARLLSRSLVRWLDRLSAAARRIASGDTGVRVPEGGDDELLALSHSFNDMADRLEEGRSREREFLMSVGHDLRTPLTTIGGYAEALEDGEPSAAEIRRIGSVLGAETGRLRRLVDDLMLLARLEAREFTLTPEPVDVAAHLREVVDGFGPRARRARVRLDVHVEPTGVRMIDPDRLAQIVANLLENALRYTPEAGVVRVSAGAEEGQIRLEVGDSGPGIDPDDLPYAFEKFYVARRYRRIRPEGSGLGLTIVRQLTQAMGGEVSLASTVGQGTTVTVIVPAEMTKSG
jgi:two-component system sensor histidine kinase BaeS